MKHVLPLFLLAALSCSLVAQPAWVRQHLQSQDTVLFGIAFTDAGHGITVGTDGVMYRTTDGGGTWISRSSGTTERLTRVRFFSPTLGFIVGGNGTLLKTADGGETWTALDTKTTSMLNDVHFFDEDSGFVVGQAGIIRATKDKGATWTAVSSDMEGNNIFSIAFATNRRGACAGNAGKISVTTNAGRTWNAISTGSPYAFFGIAFATAARGTAVGDNGKVYSTTNGGLKWTEDFTSVPISSYTLEDVLFPDSTTGFIVGFYGMVLRKGPGDQMWIALDNPHTDALQSMSFLTPKLGYACGWHSTVLKTENGGMAVGAESVPAAAAAPLLAQGYPNPLRLDRTRSATIAFALPERTHATLTVYNALGEIVATLFDEELAPGRYIRSWDVPSLPAGLYYYRLAAGSRMETRTISILR